MSALTSFSVRPKLPVVAAKLKRRMRSISDTGKSMKLASIFLDQWVQKNFKTEGGQVGGWQSFKIGGRWIAGKGLDTSARLLQDTGRLRISFLPFHTKNNAGIGSDLPYSKAHDEGTKHLPERRILPEREEVIKPIARILRVHVERLTRRRL